MSQGACAQCQSGPVSLTQLYCILMKRSTAENAAKSNYQGLLPPSVERSPLSQTGLSFEKQNRRKYTLTIRVSIEGSAMPSQQTKHGAIHTLSYPRQEKGVSPLILPSRRCFKASGPAWGQKVDQHGLTVWRQRSLRKTNLSWIYI